MKKKESKNILLKNKVSKRVANLSKVGNPYLLETIKVQNRKFHNIEYHNDRFNTSRNELFGAEDFIFLEEKLSIPMAVSSEIYKLRITYAEKIVRVQGEVYKPRLIQSLKLVECNEIEYSYKYADRSKLNELFEKREDCDDVLIIKNGLVTDTSYANIVFWDGENWITPASLLLKGTARTRLLKTRKIVEAEVKAKDLKKFKVARIINAMNDLEDSNDILDIRE